MIMRRHMSHCDLPDDHRGPCLVNLAPFERTTKLLKAPDFPAPESHDEVERPRKALMRAWQAFRNLSETDRTKLNKPEDAFVAGWDAALAATQGEGK